MDFLDSFLSLSRVPTGLFLLLFLTLKKVYILLILNDIYHVVYAEYKHKNMLIFIFDKDLPILFIN